MCGFGSGLGAGLCCPEGFCAGFAAGLFWPDGLAAGGLPDGRPDVTLTAGFLSAGLISGLRLSDTAGLEAVGFDSDGLDTVADDPPDGRVTLSFDEDEDLAGEAFVPEEVVFEDDGRLTVAVERDDADLLVDDDERETELEDERDVDEVRDEEVPLELPRDCEYESNWKAANARTISIAADFLADNLIDTIV